MKYIFVGEGIGVPGLPHEITDDEAKDLGVSEILKAAVENGNYKAIVQNAKAQSKKQKVEETE